MTGRKKVNKRVSVKIYLGIITLSMGLDGHSTKMWGCAQRSRRTMIADNQGIKATGGGGENEANKERKSKVPSY